MTETPSLTLERLLETYSPYVWRVVRYMGVGESDIPDVCQEVFLVIHRKLADFQGRSEVSTWIYGICLRTVSAYRRKAHRRREIPVSAPKEEVDRGLERTDMQLTLEALLEHLSEEKRAVVVLYEIEGLKMREIAQVLDCPMQTAYSRLHAARRELQALVRGGTHE